MTHTQTPGMHKHCTLCAAADVVPADVIQVQLVLSGVVGATAAVV